MKRLQASTVLSETIMITSPKQKCAKQSIYGALHPNQNEFYNQIKLTHKYGLTSQ